MRLRLTTVAIAVATLLAGATVGTTTGPANAGTTAEDKVRITIVVHGCDTCRLGLVQLREGDTSQWSTPTEKVKHGKVVFRVPAERTDGTSIWISAPWTSDYVHGGRYVAVRYGGFEPGDKVGPRQAARARRGSRCWSGTNHDRTLHVRVVRYDSETIDGQSAVGLRAFASRTLPSTDMQDVSGGTIVTSYPVCPAG